MTADLIYPKLRFKTSQGNDATIEAMVDGTARIAIHLSRGRVVRRLMLVSDIDALLKQQAESRADR